MILITNHFEWQGLASGQVECSRGHTHAHTIHNELSQTVSQFLNFISTNKHVVYSFETRASNKLESFSFLVSQRLQHHCMTNEGAKLRFSHSTTNQTFSTQKSKSIPLLFKSQFSLQLIRWLEQRETEIQSTAFIRFSGFASNWNAYQVLLRSSKLFTTQARAQRVMTKMEDSSQFECKAYFSDL